MVAGVADAAVRERVVREGRGNPLFLRELARVADRGDGALPATLVAAVALEVAALGDGAARADRGRGGRRRPVRPRARRGRRAGLDAAVALGGARRARRRRPRAPGGERRRRRRPRSASPRSSSRAGARSRRCGAPPVPVPPAGDRGARSSSGTRSCGARSTTARRPAGGSARTSGPRPRSRGAAPDRSARAFHVVRSAHVGDPEAIAVLARRGRGAGESLARGRARTGTRAALRLVPDREHETARRPARAPGASRSPAPGGSPRRARRCWRRSRCAPAARARRSPARASRPTSACTPTPAGGCSPRAPTRRPSGARRSRSSWPRARSTRAASTELRALGRPGRSRRPRTTRCC